MGGRVGRSSSPINSTAFAVKYIRLTWPLYLYRHLSEKLSD